MPSIRSLFVGSSVAGARYYAFQYTVHLPGPEQQLWRGEADFFLPPMCLNTIYGRLARGDLYIRIAHKGSEVFPPQVATCRLHVPSGKLFMRWYGYEKTHLSVFVRLGSCKEDDATGKCGLRRRTMLPPVKLVVLTNPPSHCFFFLLCRRCRSRMEILHPRTNVGRKEFAVPLFSADSRLCRRRLKNFDKRQLWKTAEKK